MLNRIILVHTAIQGMSIPDSTISDALEPLGINTNDQIVRIQPCDLPLREFDNVPWGALAADQEDQFQQQLAPALLRQPDSPIVYFGLAPIPLAIHLGSLIGQKPRVLARLHHHNDRSWRWPQATPTPKLMAPWTSPSLDPDFDGEVVLRVHTSYRIDPESTRQALTGPIRDADIRTQRHHPDALQSSMDLDTAALQYAQALIDSCNAYPKAQMRHVFASVPVGLALLMGTAINPSIHTPIQTWKYMSGRASRYRRAILIGAPFQPPCVLVIGASPPDTPDISAASEVQEITEILQQPSHGEPIEVTSNQNAAIEGLSALLHQVSPHFIHIASHGRAPRRRADRFRDISPDDGALILGDRHAPERSREAELRDLVRYLDTLPRLQVVVTTACHSDEFARALQRHNRIAIGFKGKLGDTAARAFSRAFWTSMMRPGCSVADAFHTGCVEMGRPDREQALLLPEGSGKNVYLIR